MKKVFALAIAVMMAAAMFVGCGDKGMKDGTYKATFKNASYGWTEYVELTVSGGKITAADFDAVNEAGDRKSENEEYEKSMRDSGATTGPMEFYAEYEQKLLDKQKVDDVDAIATASESLESLKTLVKALEKNMAKGDTTEVVVDNAE